MNPGTPFEVERDSLQGVRDALMDAPIAQGPALVPYVTAGFPLIDSTVDLLVALQEAGAAAAEVGIAHTDPLADGPTIQRTGMAALENGMSLSLAVEQVEDARRRGVTIPLILMSYFNPIRTYGIDAFIADAEAAGVKGLIVPDLPCGEDQDLRRALLTSPIAHIPMVAPTTTQRRLKQACAGARGFIYCVAVTGTTGARDSVSEDAIDLLQRVRDVSEAPRALGFGISRAEHVRSVWGRCEAVIVASALLDALWASSGIDPADVVRTFVRGLRSEG